ncbi:hypothetical protein [Burkholderia arboris]|nr:hypothetical protein [Burkholderia arboris]
MLKDVLGQFDDGFSRERIAAPVAPYASWPGADQFVQLSAPRA